MVIILFYFKIFLIYYYYYYFFKGKLSFKLKLYTNTNIKNKTTM